MGAGICLDKPRLLKSVVGSQASSNNQLDPLMVDGVCLYFFEVTADSVLLQNLLMLLQDRGGNARYEGSCCEGVNCPSDPVEIFPRPPFCPALAVSHAVVTIGVL